MSLVLFTKDANFKASYNQEKTLNKLNKILKSSGVVIIIENKNVFSGKIHLLN